MKSTFGTRFKTLSLVILIFAFMPVFSQNYYKVGDSIFNDEDFESRINLIKKEFDPKFVSFNVFEKVIRNDSIISNVSIFAEDKFNSSQYNVYSNLNKVLPEFYLKDLNNETQSAFKLIKGATLICLFENRLFVEKKVITKLNNLYTSKTINVVAFLYEENPTVNIENIKFPVLKGSWNYINTSLKTKSLPQYLLVNNEGIITYIFNVYPKKESSYFPIDSFSLGIFNKMLLEEYTKKNQFIDRTEP